ncbi:MAG: hypothetical protein IT428_26470 [Planctomycetaceae bacterium]|nr:hypothetical protein [Planctomycetaceae bacterium]
MAVRSNVQWKDLRQLLLDVGFVETKKLKGLTIFEHFEKGTGYSCSPYRLRERVSVLDVQTARRTLHATDLVPKQTFDERLSYESR